MGHDFVDVGRCTRETQPGGLCQFHDKLCVRCGRDGLLLRRAQGQLNEPLHSRRLPQLHLVLHFSLVLVASHANYEDEQQNGKYAKTKQPQSNSI